MNSRGAGGLCLLVGVALTAWTWRSALTDGHYALKAALFGPTLAVLGIGLLIHGKGIPTSGATRLTRIYGVAGGMATILNLYLLGFFDRPARHQSVWLLESAMPFLLLFVWALPNRFFGGTPTAPVERTPHERSGAPRPIEPK
jgi:hypothetical protein